MFAVMSCELWAGFTMRYRSKLRVRAKPLLRAVAEQIVGRERRGRVSHHDLSGDD
jgi:hypothetical protein